MTRRPGTAPSSMADWATDEIRNRVLSGELQPGQTINIVDYAAQIGVSQTPMREALRHLSAEGLLQYSPNRGVTVTPASEGDAADISVMRYYLESMALEKSMLKADDRWREELSEAYQALADARESDPAEQERAHHEFHLALHSRCESVVLSQFVERLLHHSARYRALRFRKSLFTDRVERHRALFEACMANDIEGAVQALQEHITLVGSAQLQMLSGGERPATKRGRSLKDSSAKPPAKRSSRPRSEGTT